MSVAPRHEPAIPARGARKTPSRAVGALCLALLLAAALVAYLPALRAGFVWDDDDYVTKNPLLGSGAGLAEIWTSPRATPQYYPLVFTSFWVEHRLWGLRPFGYHLVNVLLHALNAALVWLLLRRLSPPGAWLAAAVFLLHPVHVESVAWVTERKNLLSGACYLGAALAWLSFEDPDAPGRRRWGPYALSLTLFAGALLSKSVTATLPVALLVLRWWRTGRLAWRDAAPLAPFFALGAAAGLHTAWLERSHVGAQGPWWDLGLAGRVIVAGRALWFYLGKLLWPEPLIFVYPRWRIDPTQWWQYAAPLAAAALVAGLALGRRRLGRGPLAAALFFGVSLLPALGLLNVYPMRYSWVADHFQYLASLGPIALAASAAASLPLLARRPPLRRGLAAALLATLGLLTWRQGHAYADKETLWRDTVAKDPGSPIAHTSLGVILEARGDLRAAKAHYETALEREPLLAEVHYNLGIVAFKEGDLARAGERFAKAIELLPGYADAHTNLGAVLVKRGDLEGARRQFERALETRPDHVDALYDLGVISGMQGRPAEARRWYERALRARPRHADALYNLGLVLLQLGEVDEAERSLERAVALNPGLSDARARLQRLRAARGRQ